MVFFDDERENDGAAIERFQPRLQELQNEGTNWQETEASVTFNWTFFLVENGSNERKPISLKKFWINPIDVDSNPGNINSDPLNRWPHAEFIQLPSDLVISDDPMSDAGVIYTLPVGQGGNGEKGPASEQWYCPWWNPECQPVGSSDGTKNLIRFDPDSNRFLGAEYWTAFNTDTLSNETDLSNVPAASILLDYKKAVKTLTITIGHSGQINPGAGVGVVIPASFRLQWVMPSP